MIRGSLLLRASVSLATAVLIVLGAMGPSSIQGNSQVHERLRTKNTFKTPEEVVAYYCSRDASGFVWSGLLDSERKAFTTWDEAPEQDTFFIARDYKVQPSRKTGANTMRVTVSYEIEGIGDAHGTRIPTDEKLRKVDFELVKVDGAWKISKPAPMEMAPVVLLSKFPYAASTETAGAQPSSGNGGQEDKISSRQSAATQADLAPIARSH